MNLYFISSPIIEIDNMAETLPSTYKACVYSNPGTNEISIRDDMPMPKPGPGEVLVKMYAYHCSILSYPAHDTVDSLVSAVLIRAFAILTWQ